MKKLWFKVRAFLNGEKTLVLKRIGNWKQGNRTYNLRDYFIDQDGNLYSNNWLSWEITHLHQLLKCSDNTVNKSGKVHNTLRTVEGIKVTVVREKLIREFNNMEQEIVVVVNPVTSRHFKTGEIYVTA